MNNKLYALKVLLVIQTIGLLIYSVIAIHNDGIDFLTRFQEFATSLTWMGQFALDFQCYLMLSALWIAWRNKFSIKSILIAVVAMILGIIVFAPYLLFLLTKEKGNLKKVLIGNRE
ncbi:hypothetical protein ACOKFD_09930 [Flagellimonas sp. S174]|uniref:hypothetical protein n=1 Tax=Flagellimonas sp. S174 TaxID=3410790 RepID=UPI003BF4D9F5